MKKFTLILLLLVASLTKSKGQYDLVWQPYPISYNTFTNVWGSTLIAFSVYDSTLAITVHDTSRYDFYGNGWYIQNSGIVTYNEGGGDKFYVRVYDHERHQFKIDSVYYSFSSCGGYPLGNWVISECNWGGSYWEAMYYDIVNGIFNKVTFNESASNVSFEGNCFITLSEYGEAIADGYARALRPGTGGSVYSYVEDLGGASAHAIDGIAYGFSNEFPIGESLNISSNRNAGNINVLSNGCNINFNTRNGYVYYGNCDSNFFAIDDNWTNQWVKYKLPYAVTAASKVLLKDGVCVFVNDTGVTAKVFTCAYNTNTHTWDVDSTSSTGVNAIAITNGTVSWTDNSSTAFQRGYTSGTGWANGTTLLDIRFYVDNMDSTIYGNLVYTRNYTIGTEAIQFSFSDGFTSTQKSTSRLFKINGTYFSQPGTIQVCQTALGQTVCQNANFTRCGNPTATVVPSYNGAVCTGDSVTLTAYTNFGSSYQWKLNGTDIGGATTASYTATQSGSYTCQVTSSCNGTSSLSNSYVVNVVSPLITISTNKNVICGNAFATLTASNLYANSYSWFIDTTLTGFDQPYYSAFDGGIYTCQATFHCGTFTSNQLSILSSPLPSVAISPSANFNICVNTPTTLSGAAGAGNVYQWKKNGSNISNATSSSYIVPASGITGSNSFGYVVTNSLGCSNTSSNISINVVNSYAATISAGGSTSFCVGGGVTLAAGPGTSYQWRKDAVNIFGATQQTFYTSAAGSYTCEVSSTCGTSISNTITTTLTGIPTVFYNENFANGNALASSGYPQWAATNAGTNPTDDWLWVSPQPLGTLNVLGATNGYMRVSSNNQFGTGYSLFSPAINCSGRSTVYLSFNYAFIADEAKVYVSNDSINWTNVTNFTSSASGNSAIINISSVAASQPKVYLQFYMHDAGCSGTCPDDYFAVDEIKLLTSSCNLTASIISNSTQTTFCSGDSSQLYAYANGACSQYQWRLNGVTISGATNQTYYANVSGDYTCVITTNCGSAFSNSVFLSFSNTPSVNIVVAGGGGTSTLCSGGNVIFVARSGLSYQWKKNGSNITGATSNSYVTSLPGNYSCDVTLSCGTFSSNTLSIVAPPSSFYYEPFTNGITGAGMPGWNTETNCPNPTDEWFWNTGNIGLATSGAATGYMSIFSNNEFTCLYGLVSPAINCSGRNTVYLSFQQALASYGGSSNVYVSTDSINWTNVASYTTTPNPSLGVINISSIAANQPKVHLKFEIVDFMCPIGGCATDSYFIDDVKLSDGTCNLTSSISAAGSTILCSGGAVVLNAATTGACVTYQWKLNGNNISGATAASFSASAVGTYTCSISNFCGTAGSNAITVSQATAVSISSSPSNAQVCEGDVVSLSAVSFGTSSYLWKQNGSNISGATNAYYNATTSGQYTCQITNTCGVFTPGAINVFIDPLPVTFNITVSTSTDLCVAGGAVQMDVFSTYDVYQWQLNGVDLPGENSAFLFATAVGIYTCKGTTSGVYPCGTEVSFPVTVTNSAVASITAGGSTTFCPGGSVTLTANSGTSYQWKENGVNINAATLQNYSATATGNYTCEVTSTCGAATSNSIAVTVNPAPSANITAGGSTTFCPGGSVTLTANSGTSYQWKENGVNINAATLQNYSATATGNYTCEVTSTCGAATSNTIVVNVLTSSATITANGPTSFCLGGGVNLIAPTGSGFTYQWQNNGGNLGSVTNSSFYATSPGNFSCILTTPCGSYLSNVIAVSIIPSSVPTVTANGSTALCSGGSVTLTATGTNNPTSFSWMLNGVGIAGATNATYVATQGGGYSCYAYNACSGPPSNIVTVTTATTPLANINLTGPSTVCAGAYTTLSANTGSGLLYQWKLNGVDINGATSSTHNATAAGNYTCEVSNICNLSALSNSISISVSGIAHTSVITGCPYLTGSGTSLTASSNGSGVSYMWLKNGNLISGATNNTYFTFSGTGAYTCIISSSCGSVLSNTIDVVLPPTSITITAPSGNTNCSGTGVSLSAQVIPNVQYFWKINGTNISGATTSSYLATASGDYTCQIVPCNSFGVTSNTIAVDNGLPNASIFSGGSTTFCNGGTVTLSVTSSAQYSGLTYQWLQNGSIIPGSTSNGNVVTSSGNYECLISNSCGTITSNAIAVTVNPTPIAAFAPAGAIAICTGLTQTFTATTGTGYSYQWKRNGTNLSGATNTSYVTANAGTYTLQTTLGSCSVTSAGTVLAVNPQPASTATALTPTTVCNGGGVVFTANSGTGLTYQWQKNSANIAGATNMSYTATTAGSYRVTVTNNNGCTKNSNAISAAFTGTSVTAGVTVVGSTTFCEGSGTYLKETTSIPGYNYQWQNNGVDVTGATLATFTPIISGTYTVRVTSSCGTALSAQQIITVNPLPLANITASGSTSICTGSSVILNAQTGSGYTYQWQLNGSTISNETNSSYNASAAGTYTCAVTNSCGSVTSNSIVVTVGSTPSASITAQGNTALCGTATVQLDANSGIGLLYQWQLNGADIIGATNQSYVANTAGSYTCIVTSACGTATSNAINVTAGAVPPQPAAIIGITESCNPQNNVTFSIPAVAGATSYNWYSTNPAVTINPPNGGTTISVNLGATTSSTWSLRVEPINACGTGTFRSTSIRRIVSGVTTVTGTSSVCGVTNGVVYSCNSVGGADDYLWTVPTGATLINGQGTTSITVNYGSTFNGGSVCVSSRLNCGFTANPKCFAVTKGTAASVGNVSGNSTVCAGGSGNFSVVPVTGVTYNWTVPSGANITSGAGTNAVTVLFPSTFSSGSVCVNVTNSCGVTSPTKCRSVTNAAPARPAGVTGNISGVCGGLENYTAAASTNATSYLWNVTGGSIQSGQGTQTVSVLWNSSGTTGTLNVNGVNSCGNGLVRNVSVNLKPSSTASITGNTAACANTAEVYNFTSLYGATNYLWSVNTVSGAAVTAGQGTTSATIQWVTNGGTVYCTPSNACGSSSTKTLAVSITCRQATQGVVDENNLFNVSAIPNPFNNELNIQSSVYGNGVTLNIADMLGRIISTQPINSENTLLQTSQLKNGIYFVEVINVTEKKTIKVVKAE